MMLAAVAAGGAFGSLGRWALARALPTSPDALPLATLVTNIAGSFALGVLMVLAAEVWPHRRHLRPFLGTGVLGGFTTFSTWMLETRNLGAAGHLPTAVGYLALTLATGLPAAWLGLVSGRRLVRQGWGDTR